MKTENFILPAYWAYYLSNNDKDGLQVQEAAEINEWLDRNNIIFPCLSASEHSFFAWSNDAKKLGGDCLVYTFCT